MKDTELVVYREYFGRFEEVGRVAPAGGGIGFAYSESYLQSRTAQSISQALPLRSGAFPARETESFFNGILPEGSMRRSLGRAFHADIDDVGAFMARLNDESAGALVFGKGEEPLLEGRSYAPVGEEDLVRFAARPGEFAPRAASRSRLSLAGAQMKIGLFFDASSGFWFYPQGAAPSSHIVKACDGSFPDQTVNEAICMRTAAALGFDAAPCRLIPVAGQEPLLAVERFDRIDVGDAFLHRLHQEDFLQALPDYFDKYEPTDGNYANHCARVVNEGSRNPFGDRRLLFSRLLLDWAMGNADNHLKNHSMLWSEDWSSRELSPLYDLTCTTVYPELDREMGVSFGGSRRIDDVRAEDIVATARSCGVGARFARDELEELLEVFPSVLCMAAEAVAEEGFPRAADVGRQIEEGFLERRDALR